MTTGTLEKATAIVGGVVEELARSLDPEQGVDSFEELGLAPSSRTASRTFGSALPVLLAATNRSLPSLSTRSGKKLPGSFLRSRERAPVARWCSVPAMPGGNLGVALTHNRKVVHCFSAKLARGHPGAQGGWLDASANQR